jgi:predicted metal-dependent enzyme (double-stranded beta helix superfamily)
MRFDKEQFVNDCRSAMKGEMAPLQIQEIMARALSAPRLALEALGYPTSAGHQILYRSEDLTILNVAWGAKMVGVPHDHKIWAVIGVYTGREDNIFWRRRPDSAHGRVEASSAKALAEGDVVLLGPETIHSVINPIGRLSAGLHVYGGDFYAIARSEWNPEFLLEQPYDANRAARAFEESNHRAAG